MVCKIVPLLLSLFFVLSLLPMTTRGASPSIASFFWLKPGTQAVYAMFPGSMLFDDGANGTPFQGNYSWVCVDVNYTHAVLNVEIGLELLKPSEKVPAHILYIGTEFLEMAARGDLSFVRRIPMDQVIGKPIELFNVTAGDDFDGVSIMSPVFLSKNFQVTVDLDTMIMFDRNGEQLGKWILWIDPLKYPLAGWDQRTMEAFVTSWLNSTITVGVFYMKQPEAMPLNTMFGTVNRYFYATPENFVENQFLTDNGWSSILPAYCYEPRTGIFLTTWGPLFIDDTLTQEFGVVGYQAPGGPTAWMKLASIMFVGDLNSDWVVNILDLTVAAAAFRTKPGDERWNQVADVNKDGIINILDIAITAKAFGTQYITPD